MAHDMVEDAQAYTEALVRSGAIQIAPDADHLFELRNGTTSAVYVDHAQVLCEPQNAEPFERALGNYAVEHFPQPSSILCNVDSKSSPQLVGALAAMHRYRQIVVSQEVTQLAEKGLNARYRLPKSIAANDQLVIVDDVFTPDDTTASDVADIVKDGWTGQANHAPQEIHLLVGLLRGDVQYCVRQLGQLGIRLHWLVTLDSMGLS